jgi:molecular chaperone DnaK
VQKKQIFSTASDNQPAVTVRVLQGERPMAGDNKEIGRFDLSDIPPSPRGFPQIEVAFDVDADGILHVHAKDLASGKEQKIRIQAKSGLDESEIQRVVRDAEAHAAEDKKRKQVVEMHNEADAVVFRAEKALREYKEQIPADVASDVQQKIDAVKKALESNDDIKIATAKRELEEHMQHIGEAMAKHAGVQQPPPGTGGGPTPPPGAEGPGPKKASTDTVEDAEVIVDPE